MKNYYEEFSLDPSMDSKTICEILFKTKKMWSKRQNAAELEKRQEAERKVVLINDAIELFSDSSKRNEYDIELRKNNTYQQNNSFQNESQTQTDNKIIDENSDDYDAIMDEVMKAIEEESKKNNQSQSKQLNPNRSAYGDTNTTTSFKSNTKLTGIISYFYILGWLIAYFLGDRKGAKTHLNSSLIIHILFFLVSNIETDFISGFLLFPILILWIIGLIYAVNEEDKEVPFIGWIHIIK